MFNNVTKHSKMISHTDNTKSSHSRTKNTAKMKTFRRVLRNNGTKAEATLWKMLKAKRIGGLQFRRQFSIESYIIDFYCPALKLAIELDGDYHFHLNQPTADYKRDLKLLNKYGIRTLRFDNETVFTKQYLVVSSILNAKKELDASNSPSKLEGVPEGRGRVSDSEGEHTPPALRSTSPNLGEDFASDNPQNQCISNQIES